MTGAFPDGTFAAAGALLPDVGVGDDVAGARVQESTATRSPTAATPVRPTMIDLISGLGLDSSNGTEKLRLPNGNRWSPFRYPAPRADRPTVVVRRESHRVVRHGIDHRPTLPAVVGARRATESDGDE